MLVFDRRVPCLSAIDAMVKVFFSGTKNTASRGRKVLQLLGIVATLHPLPWPASDRFEIHVDRPKSLTGRSWRDIRPKTGAL